MSSDLKVTNIKHESSSSNNLVLGSDGNVSITNTLSAGTIGSAVAMASSGLTVRNIEQVALATDQLLDQSTAYTPMFTPTYTPKFENSTIQFVFTYALSCRRNSTSSSSPDGDDGRKGFKIVLSSANSGFTTFTWGNIAGVIGGYAYDSLGSIVNYHSSVMGPLWTTTTTGLITASVEFKNASSSTSDSTTLTGNNTTNETYMTWIEYK